MPDDSRDTERELIQQGAPLINAIGMNTAERRAALNKAVKGQLELVEAELKWYLHNDHDQMPHEWGSMDTYDDMRNSLRLAAALMDTSTRSWMTKRLSTRLEGLSHMRAQFVRSMTMSCSPCSGRLTMMRYGLP
jgi:hypothetical protein